MSVQEAALTCKAEELDQFEGIEHVLANLATAECQLSDSRFLLNVLHVPLPREANISACKESQETCNYSP